MVEVIINGHAGRLEGRYHQAKRPDAPVALILHPHPQYGGTMNNKVAYALFTCFRDLGFSVLRFNFRGVGRSQGEFEDGPGELSDATIALDWLQAQNPDARQCWIAGYSFGAWIGLQLLMRRPDINNLLRCRRRQTKRIRLSGAVPDFGAAGAGRHGRYRRPENRRGTGAPAQCAAAC